MSVGNHLKVLTACVAAVVGSDDCWRPALPAVDIQNHYLTLWHSGVLFITPHYDHSLLL